MSDTFPLPPAPDPVKIAKWAGQIRAALTVLAGFNIAPEVLSTLTAVDINADLSAIMTVFGLALYIGTALWSWIEKEIAARHANAAVVASAVASAHATAETGVPTPTLVVPAPTPTDAGATASRIVGFAEEGHAYDIVPPPTARYSA
jgi:hypothetical protein